jgi:uncharacterized membrane protein (Fun14 family)
MSFFPAVTVEMGIGGVGGFIAGYALKKLLKIVAVIIGIFILALVYLGHRGIISINYVEIGNVFYGALSLSGEVAGWITPVIAHLPFAGAFGLAFFLGFKKG